MSAQDVITDLQADCAARCEAESYFNDVVVVVVKPNSIEDDIRQALSRLLGKNGKRGVAILVLPIEDLSDDYPEIGFGPMTMQITFQVVEFTLLNNTGKPGRAIARKLRDIFKHYTPVGFSNSFVPGSPAIQYQEMESESERGWLVRFKANEADTEAIEKAARPTFSQAANAVTIASATAGASIYYTTDDTHPWSGNGAATLYATPVAVPVGGLTLRAAAFKSGLIASDVNRGEFVQS